MTLSSEFLTNVIEMLNVGVAVIDVNNDIILFSKIAGEMLQQDPEARVGTSILLCHPERAEPGVLKMIEQFRTGELEKYEGFVNFVGRILYEHITPIRDQSGKYLGAIIELRDAKEKAEYLKARGEYEEPEMHGSGESSPRSPITQ
jgi:PAS domain S-box-containing protein